MAVKDLLAVSFTWVCFCLVTREEFVGLPGVSSWREKSSDRRMGGKGGGVLFFFFFFNLKSAFLIIQSGCKLHLYLI